MSKYLLFLLLVISANIFAQDADLPERPQPARLVNDMAGVLNAQESQTLEQKLTSYNDSTSTQISIVIIRSVGVYDIADFAQRIGQKWGVGQKEKNNGIMVLVATEDRKVTIQTGYGMEERVTDAASKRIIENVIVPNFKGGNYYAGLDQATDQIMGLASGMFKAPPKAKAGKGFNMRTLIIIIVILILLSRMFRGNGGRGSTFSRRGAFLGGLGGFGGGFGGGGFGGGGGGGGGFGGFGGGSFGGGGSSGNW
ncbi:MAG TPA: TPM domain-containing protein [Cytophagaceae bacterium]